MNLRFLITKFESEAKEELHKFVDFVESYAKGEIVEKVLPKPSEDDGNPKTTEKSFDQKTELNPVSESIADIVINQEEAKELEFIQTESNFND